MDEELKHLCCELDERPADYEIALRKAKRSEKLLREIFEAAPDAKLIVDEAGKIALINAQTEKLFGYKREELVGQQVEVLLPQRFVLQHQAHRAAFANNPRARPMGVGMEFSALRKDGTEFLAEISLSLVQTDEGNLVIAALRDITDRKALEKQVQEKERLATLGTTAAVFAHEIANPLNGVSSALQMAKSIAAGLPLADTELKECIDLASAEVERLSSLLNEYRSFARPQNLKIERSDVHKLLEELLALHFRHYAARGISIELDIPDSLPQVSLDVAKMKQAILNLCQNAVDAMPNGGTLLVRACRSQANLVIEVADTGSGIPEGLDVFQLFKTTKPESTGLGLPIVQQIISEHGGSVDYVTEPGKGTTFRMILPANPIAANAETERCHDGKCIA